MQIQNNKNKFNPFSLVIIVLFIAFSINPILGGVLIVAIIFFLVKNPKSLTTYFSNYLQMTSKLQNTLTENNPDIPKELSTNAQPITPANIFNVLSKKVRLEKRKKYLHVALNSTLEEAGEIISQLPASSRVLLRAT